MDDWHDDKYFSELVEGRRSSADVTELIADDNEDAIVPMSASCAGVNLKDPKEEVKPANPRQACIVAEYRLSITTG